LHHARPRWTLALVWQTISGALRQWEI